MLNGLMKIPGNVNIAELQLGAISSQITWKAVQRAFLPGPGDRGIQQVVLNLILPLNNFLYSARRSVVAGKMDDSSVSFCFMQSSHYLARYFMEGSPG